MKKVILILLAAFAFSCGDGRNDANTRSSEAESESRAEDNYSTAPLESDTTQMEMDTTSSPGMDQGLDTTNTFTP